MAAYEYKCRSHPKITRVVHAPIREGRPLTPPVCPDCLQDMVPHYTINAHRPMQEHVSPATGMPVRSLKQAQQQLDRISDERSTRLGLEHKFVAVDPRDPVLGRTEVGMDATNKRRVDAGLPPRSP
jgi:hypothetical protein